MSSKAKSINRMRRMTAREITNKALEMIEPPSPAAGPWIPVTPENMPETGVDILYQATCHCGCGKVYSFTMRVNVSKNSLYQTLKQR
jgi:hypothetical protein